MVSRRSQLGAHDTRQQAPAHLHLCTQRLSSKAQPPEQSAAGIFRTCRIFSLNVRKAGSALTGRSVPPLMEICFVCRGCATSRTTPVTADSKFLGPARQSQEDVRHLEAGRISWAGNSNSAVRAANVQVERKPAAVHLSSGRSRKLWFQYGPGTGTVWPHPHQKGWVHISRLCDRIDATPKSGGLQTKE